ncbi:hypothetical protein ES692_07775 [Psychroserpens burtonensis]|uniref:Uncharacterized protein n=1 Tax=Psychroserpens burtonensis TaxID=49278 RepID=A0A5C7BBS3_9FLAO|nr:hypothetical protein [Psychroserpens burtonensis]TXE17788.1 hypothetical protein ES692_07775 [Psychroserpens burtonensis]
MKQVIVILFFLIIGSISYSQTETFSTKYVEFDKASWPHDFQIFYTDLRVKDINYNLKFETAAIIGLNEPLYIKHEPLIKQKFLFDNMSMHNQHKTFFRNQCGPLGDGITYYTATSDIFISNILDNFLNEYIIQKIILKK